MKYVTIPMLIAHTGKHRKTVERALKRACVATERLPGALGLRITEANANKFLLKYWPNIGTLPADLTELV